MPIATPAVDSDPHLFAYKEAFEKLSRYCMANLPEEALPEFIKHYGKVWDAYLNKMEANVAALQQKNELIARSKLNDPSPRWPDQRN